MRLAVDARPLEERPTGVGRYLEGLLSAWLDEEPSDSFVLLSPRLLHVPARLAGRVETAASPALPGTVWLQTAAARAARRAGADAFFGSLGIVPLFSSLPCVATVHDLTPLLFPEWHSRKNRLGFRPFIGATVRRARRIVAVSDATRRDLVAAFPDAAPKTVVVYNGVEAETPAVLAAAPHGGRPYVLYVGTLEPRKNVSRLLAAMESIWDRRPDFPDLILAGADGWEWKSSRNESCARATPRASHASAISARASGRAGSPARASSRIRAFTRDSASRPSKRWLRARPRGLVGVVAAGGDGRRGPPARPRERPRHRGGAGKGAGRRGFPAPRCGRGPAARAELYVGCRGG